MFLYSHSPTSPQGFHVLRQDFNPRRLADICANDGNLSIPLYVRGKAVSDEKGEYGANGMKEAVKIRTESSDKLKEAISGLLKMLG